MPKPLIIPFFDLEHQLVSGLETGRNDPAEVAGRLSAAGAGEIAFFEADMQRQQVENWRSLIDRILGSSSIPVIFGTERNTFDELEVLMDTGIDRLCLEITATSDPALIDRLARKYGSQRVVVALSGRKNRPDSKKPPFEVIERKSGHTTELDLVEWARMAEMLGAGSLVITSMDKTGKGKGYDIGLIKAVTGSVNVPVIASGGAGKPEHFRSVISKAGAAGAAATSIFISDKFTPGQIECFLTDGASSA